MRALRLFAGGACALLLAAQPAAAQLERVTGWRGDLTGRTLFAASESEQWIPFVPTPNGLIAIRGAVNGRPVLALLDTGAPYTAIDTRFAGENGIRLVQTVAPGRDRLRVFSARIESMAIGPLAQRGGRLSAIDLSSVANAMGIPITMVLGADYLRNLAVEIDFDGERLRLRASGSARPAGIAVPLATSGVASRFIAPMRIGEVPVPRVLIDTGTNGTLKVTLPIWRQLAIDPARVTSGQVRSLYGLEVSPLARLDGVAIGVAAIPARIDVTADAGGILDSPADGLIGMGALRAFNLFLDARAGVMILSPRRTPHRFLPPSTLGILGGRVPQGVLVVHVMRNSPAARAGLADGDMICAVDGQSIAAGEPMSREDWTKRPLGTTLELGLCSGRKIKVTLAEFY